MSNSSDHRDPLARLGEEFAAAERRAPVRRRPSPARAAALGATVVGVLVAIGLGVLGSFDGSSSDEASSVDPPSEIARIEAGGPRTGASTRGAVTANAGRPLSYALSNAGRGRREDLAGFVVSPRQRHGTRDLAPTIGPAGGTETSEVVANLGLLLGGSLGGVESLGDVRDGAVGRTVLPSELRPPCEERLDGGVTDHPIGGIETPRRAALGIIYLSAKRLDVVPDLERVGPSSRRARLFAVRSAGGETVIVASAIRMSNGAWRPGPFSACDWRARR